MLLLSGAIIFGGPFCQCYIYIVNALAGASREENQSWSDLRIDHPGCNLRLEYTSNLFGDSIETTTSQKEVTRASSSEVQDEPAPCMVVQMEGLSTSYALLSSLRR
jgi:hypothetical protein